MTREELIAAAEAKHERDSLQAQAEAKFQSSSPDENTGPMLNLPDGRKVPIMAGVPIGVPGAMAVEATEAIPGLLQNSFGNAAVMGGPPQEMASLELENGTQVGLGPKSDPGLLKAITEAEGITPKQGLLGNALRYATKGAIRKAAGAVGAAGLVKYLSK